MSILIKGALINGAIQDLYIQGNYIANIGNNLNMAADHIIDGSHKAVIPSFNNGHSHSAMTLLRGYADDMPLQPWLEQKIWPTEAKLNEEDVYWGSKLACLEMIKSGTTMAFDSYHFQPGTSRAFEEMGVRGFVAPVLMDFFEENKRVQIQKNVENLFEKHTSSSNRVHFAIGPHAIYSASKKLLLWSKDFAKANNLKIVMHLSETKLEVENAIKEFGMLPTEYLNSLGFLGPNVSLSHCLYLEDSELDIIADKGCQVVHNPISNMKLASGVGFKFRQMKKKGIPISFGTDGTSSNNCLDMFNTMKTGALASKASWKDPTVCTAQEAFECATAVAETMSDLKIGKIEVGYLADISLVNLDLPEMTPLINLYSNLVYSANGSCIDTVICDGNILMENRVVPGEKEIMERVRQIVKKIISNSCK